MKNGFSVHCCLLDKECRQYDPPKRIHLNTPWFHLAFALTPGSKFAGRIDVNQYPEKIVSIERAHWTSLKKHKPR
jgi:hypothetical protein